MYQEVMNAMWSSPKWHKQFTYSAVTDTIIKLNKLPGRAAKQLKFDDNGRSIAKPDCNVQIDIAVLDAIETPACTCDEETPRH